MRWDPNGLPRALASSLQALLPVRAGLTGMAGATGSPRVCEETRPQRLVTHTIALLTRLPVLMRLTRLTVLMRLTRLTTLTVLVVLALVVLALAVALTLPVALAIAVAHEAAHALPVVLALARLLAVCSVRDLLNSRPDVGPRSLTMLALPRRANGHMLLFLVLTRLAALTRLVPALVVVP